MTQAHNGSRHQAPSGTASYAYGAQPKCTNGIPYQARQNWGQPHVFPVAAVIGGSNQLVWCPDIPANAF